MSACARARARAYCSPALQSRPNPQRYDGNYYPNTDPISWLPEGTPAALSQQMSAVVGDFFYATLIDNGPDKRAKGDDEAVWVSTYINMYRPRP